jgi:hypothetical protein
LDNNQTTQRGVPTQVQLRERKGPQSRPNASSIYLKATVKLPTLGIVPTSEAGEAATLQNEAQVWFTPDQLQLFVEQVSAQAAIRALEAQHHFNVQQGESNKKVLTKIIKSLSLEFGRDYHNGLIDDLEKLGQSTNTPDSIPRVQSPLQRVFPLKYRKRNSYKVRLRPAAETAERYVGRNRT